MESFITTLIAIALYRIVIWSSGGRIVYSKATTVAQNVTLGIFIGLCVISVAWVIIRAGW